MRSVSVLLTMTLLSSFGCDPGNPGSTCPLGQLPATYVAPDYETNAAVELGVRTRLKALLQPMKDAEANLSVTPTANELRALFDAGSPSLRSLTTSYYAGLVDAWIDQFAAAAGNAWTPSSTPTGPGGKYGAYIFNSSGTDLRQAIEKGLFDAALFQHAYNLMTGTITPATIDRLIAIYGANPSFPNDDRAAQNPDEFIASYAERRDSKSAQNPGPYVRIRNSFIAARAAAAATGDSCATELSTALTAVRSEWERVVFSTVIFYLNNASERLSASAPTETDMAAALHSYGEAVGFIHGWRNLPQQSRTITDTQLDELLTLLGAPVNGTVTSYRLITDTASQLPNLSQAITRVATIYGFTAQQIESFKINY